MAEFSQYLGEGFKLRNRTFIVRHGLVRTCLHSHQAPDSLQAESNVKQVLVTKPEQGTTLWGLVEEGRKQAKAVRHLASYAYNLFDVGCKPRYSIQANSGSAVLSLLYQTTSEYYCVCTHFQQAGEKLKELIGSVSSEDIVIVSSDFTRTRETAEIIHSTLQPKVPLRLNEGLRERDMGDMDLLHVSESMTPNLFDLWKNDEEDVMTAEHNAESVATIAARMSAVVKSVNQEFAGKVVILVSHQDPLHILHALFVGLPLAQHNKQEPPIGNCDIRELITQ